MEHNESGFVEYFLCLADATDPVAVLNSVVFDGMAFPAFLVMGVQVR